MKRHPNWMKDFALLFASVSMLLGGLEILSRLIRKQVDQVPYNTYLVHDSTLGWKLAPNRWLRIVSQAKGFGFECKINHLGFREDDQGMLKPQDCDVILIGDSNVFGYGLTAEETLSSQLSSMLKVEGRPAKVLNAGVPGYGYDQFYLRLIALGPLKENTQVIVVTQPRNDGINTCNDVDYNAYKPVAQIQSDAAVFPKVPLINPACESHFSGRFHRMNQVFRLKPPKRPSWLHRFSLKSDLVFLLINARHLTLAKIPSQVKEVIWDQTSPEAYATSRLEQVRKNPQSLAMRVWPEIRQFDDERQHMIELVGFLLSKIDQHLKAMQCQMLLVLLPDPARLQAFYKVQTDLLQQSIPDYQFEWGWAQRALRDKLKALEIPFIEPQYASDELQSMFVPLDGHVSGKAFGLIAKGIAAKFAWRMGQSNYLSQQHP